MSEGIGSHTKPNKGRDTIWLTPPAILRALGEFDLDPCAAPEPRPWPTAKAHYGEAQDGLAQDWKGRVWMNPPYGDGMEPWMKRMAEHQNGIALTFARTETKTWKNWIWPYATAILFIYGRLDFHLPDGTRAKGNAGGPSVLIAYSIRDMHALQKSGIQGKLIRP
jgi:hypothetical protein